MRNGKAGSRCSVLAAVVCLMVGPLTRVNAQIINPGNAGNNAIWADSTHISPSTAYIDADVFATANGGPGGSDLCAILNYIYTNSIIPAGGAVSEPGLTVAEDEPRRERRPRPLAALDDVRVALVEDERLHAISQRDARIARDEGAAEEPRR